MQNLAKNIVESLAEQTKSLNKQTEALISNTLGKDCKSSSYEKIIRDFDSKKSNVLIGTQMVSKGLDFGGVDTVGIMNADSLMNFPDFRSHERAFQLIEQVAGRAG